jgi:hypothetical protein
VSLCLKVKNNYPRVVNLLCAISKLKEPRHFECIVSKQKEADRLLTVIGPVCQQAGRHIHGNVCCEARLAHGPHICIPHCLHMTTRTQIINPLHDPGESIHMPPCVSLPPMSAIRAWSACGALKHGRRSSNATTSHRQSNFLNSSCYLNKIRLIDAPRGRP